MRNNSIGRPLRFGLRSRVTRFASILSLAGALALAPQAAGANEDGEEATGAGLGVGAMACTLVYGPAKLVYALLGTTTSGLAYLFTGGDWEVAKPIYTSSFYGDYIVTPEHLTGERSLEFVGRADAVDGGVAAGGDGIPMAPEEPLEDQL